MNKDTVTGDWKILKGKIKSAWGKLSDDQIESMKGDFSKLEGQIQKAYGLSKEEASKKFTEFKDSLSENPERSPGEERINRTSFDTDVNQPRSRRDRDVH
ncbi:MAG: CsbD family protein [Bdellovibrio sp.]|nr:CsbD family protein [Bdellovibrio sp.]